MAEQSKWYKSDIANYFGIATIVTAVAFGAPSFVRGFNDLLGPSTHKVEMEKARLQHELKLQVAGLNGNGIPEKFYSIDGKIALVELDGKPVSDLFKR